MDHASLLPSTYILVLTGTGLLVALVAWLPLALRKLPLSLPIVCMGIGATIFCPRSRCDRCPCGIRTSRSDFRS
jgi:hypothetical protein